MKELSSKEMVQPQPQQEWSQEDERKIELLQALIEDAKGDSVSYSTMFREMEELNNWVKSIKERVQPQTQQ